MRSSCALLLFLLSCSKPCSASESKNVELQAKLKALMDNLATETGFALQLGWKSADADFSLAAGEYKVGPSFTQTKKCTTDDTFLFGSGTKPFTSAMLFGLVSKGVVNLDDPVSKHVDKVMEAIKPGTSMASLFGSQGSQITVRHVVFMRSGVADFDVPDYDQRLLWQNQTYNVHLPLEFVQVAAAQPTKLNFPPGTQVEYSSTNYVLAGFVVLAHANGATWDTIDFKSFFPPDLDSVKGIKFYHKEMINDYLTVPGSTGGGYAHLPNEKIWNQSSTVLGWSCGNMVTTAGHVARFLWDLLGPEPKVLPAAVVEEMKQFKPLSFGWAKGGINYGGGLMIESAAAEWGHGTPNNTKLGDYMGHGGDTYGFLSEQGIAYGLNASISVIANQDMKSTFVSMTFMCNVINTAASVLLADSQQSIKCMPPH